MVLRSVNRGRQRRCHELHLSTLTTTRRTHPATLGTPVLMANCDLLMTGLTSRTWAHSPKQRRSLAMSWRIEDGHCSMYGDRSLPPFTNRKEQHQYPDLWRHMTPPHQRFFPSRIFPRCVPSRARVCTRPVRTGSPTGPVFGPWLFSTAEARTSNSSSSSPTKCRCAPFLLRFPTFPQKRTKEKPGRFFLRFSGVLKHFQQHCASNSQDECAPPLPRPRNRVYVVCPQVVLSVLTRGWVGCCSAVGAFRHCSLSSSAAPDSARRSPGAFLVSAVHRDRSFTANCCREKLC